MDDSQRLETYKSVSFVTKLLLVVNAIAAVMLLISPSYWIMSLLGLGVLTQASLVLMHRHVIMDEYVHELDGKEVSKLNAPSAIVYQINVYVIWPVLFIGGLVMFIWGFISL